MNEKSVNLEALSTRAGFNSAVRYINKTIEFSERLESNNFGDLLHECGDEDLTGKRGALLLRMLLIDKLGYKAASANLSDVSADVPALSREFGKWKAVDLVAVYHHPDLGPLIANPKAAEELIHFGTPRKDELMVVYAGKGNAPADAACKKAAELAIALFEGRKVKVPPELLKGNFPTGRISKASPTKLGGGKAKKAPPTKAPRTRKPSVELKEAEPVSKGSLRMTPRYSVAVTNELFHNGNVEAWKRIIESYNDKYPELKVYIYYEGERILDINSLLMWGKVKHGSVIQFAVAGDSIKDVAKLQRYLAHGASNRVETFLTVSPGIVLKLFG